MAFEIDVRYSELAMSRATAASRPVRSGIHEPVPVFTFGSVRSGRKAGGVWPVRYRAVLMRKKLRAVEYAVTRRHRQEARHNGGNDARPERVGGAMIEPVKQRTERECGPACLAMICQDIGIPVSQEDISVLLRTGPRGVSAHRIIETAARLGLHARGIALSAEHMQHVFLPCIAHWCNTHFVVVERVDRHGVTMIDPGVGRLTISSRRFAQLFSGTAIEFEQTGP